MSNQEATKTSSQWVIDQIDQGWAELQSMAVAGVEQESVQVTLPVSLLPKNIQEGTVLTLTFALDLEASQKAKNEVQETINELSAADDGDDFSL